MNPRLYVVTVVLVAAATLAWRGLWRLWVTLATALGEYRLIFGFLDPTLVLLLVFHLLLCVALGFLVIVLAKPNRPLVVGAVAGVLFELALNFRSRNWWTPELRYGFYVAAPLGSLVGARIATWFGGLRRAAAV